MYTAQDNLEQLFENPNLSNYFSTRLTDRNTLTLLATATSEKHKYIHHSYLAALIEFFRQNPQPNAQEVMCIIQALYDACPEPSQTLNNVFIQLLENAMKYCIHYLNKHAEMVTKALEQGYLLDDTLCDYGPEYFVKQINQHKNFKAQYDTIQCQNSFGQLNILNKMAKKDWKNRSKPDFIHTGGEVKVISVKDNPNYINYIEKQQHSILIHRLRVIIETLSIDPSFAAYIIFDQRIASTQASFKDYLLGKVNNLAMHPDTFSRRFRGLAGIVLAILIFQNSNLTKESFDNFIQRLQSAAKIYKDQQGETHAYNAMQDVYIARIRHTWPIAQLQDNHAINNYLVDIYDSAFLDNPLLLGDLSCQISLILNTDSVKACFQEHFTALDHDLLSYLENKIKSNKSMNMNPYKHLSDVLNLLILLTGEKDASFESRLIECCAAMGSTGMKKYLSLRRLDKMAIINNPESLLVQLRQTANEDEIERQSRELFSAQLAIQTAPTVRINNNYEYKINDENRDEFIMQLRVIIIYKLIIEPAYEDYIDEVKRYLLQTLDNLAWSSDFLGHFIALIHIVDAIWTFQKGDLTKVKVDQFVKRLDVSVMQNFDVTRLGSCWAIVQLNRLLNERIHADTLAEDVLRVLKNNNDVKSYFKTGFVALDSELLAYLEKKVYSPKHLKDVLNLLLLLVDTVNYGTLQAFENALYQCCKAMGSTGMKDYLQQRLNHAENLELIYVRDAELKRAIYSPEMRQQALITWLSCKSTADRQSLFAEFHGNTRFAWSERHVLLTDWIMILKAGKALPFYQDYLDYLRQPDPDFPECYRFETEFYPMLLHFYNNSKNLLEKLLLDSAFFTEASAVLWSIVDDLFERLPLSLHRYRIDISSDMQQAAIAQFRAIFRKYVLPPQKITASEVEAVTFDRELAWSMYENFALNVSGRRRLMQAIRQMTHADFIQIIPEYERLKIAALLKVFNRVPNHYDVVKRRLESALISQIEKALSEEGADHNVLMDCLTQWLIQLQFKNFIECSPVINEAFCVFFRQDDAILKASRCETTLIPLILNMLRAVKRANSSQKKAAYDYAHLLLRRVGIVAFDSLTIQSMREAGVDVSGFQFREMDCNNNSKIPSYEHDMRLLMSAQRAWNFFNQHYSSDTTAIPGENSLKSASLLDSSKESLRESFSDGVGTSTLEEIPGIAADTIEQLLERGFSNYSDNRFQFHMLIKWIATHKSEPDDISILMKHVTTHLNSLQQACSIPREHLYFANYVNAFFSGNANFYCDTESFDRLKLTLGHFVDMVQAANSVDEEKSVNTCMAVSGNLESAGAITEAQKAQKICDFLIQLSRALMSNPALQQNIVDDDECLRLLGILFLEVPVGKSDVVKKEDYAAFINMRDLRNSVTGLHSFSHVIETLARENPTAAFKSTFAWWFAQQSITWASWAVGTKLAARIETIIRDAGTGAMIAPESAKHEPENIISAHEFFCKHNPDFESFQARYPETRDFFSKEDYVFFLQDQKFEEKMQNFESTSLEGITQLHEMVCADQEKAIPSGDALYIDYISPKRAEQLGHIFEKVAEKMPELTSIPTGASLRIVDYLIHKVHNLAKNEDVWLRHFKGLVEIAKAIIAYERHKNKETLVNALNKAVETYKGTPSNTTSFLGKGIETNTMRDVYMAHLIAQIGLTVDNSEKEGTEMNVIGSSNSSKI